MRKALIVSFVLLLVVGLVVGGAGAWIVFGPNTESYEAPRGVKIPRGASFAQVVDSLEAGGVLASRRTLRWMGKATGWGGQVKAGYYTFESGASNYDLLDTIRRGLQTPVRVTIPPGVQPEAAAAVAASQMAFPADSFLTALHDTAFAAALDTDTTHLFGYVVPQTYQFYWLASAETVIRRAVEQFDTVWTDALAARADSLGLTQDEVVTLASIIQWETGLPEEKPVIAGVYLNRLRIGMPLQADPTVQYAVLQAEGSKRRLFYRDYDLEHPYNTYNYRGLPPGPLTNPARSTIEAVLHPEEHDYLYFVARPGGGHHFSETLREHNRAAQRYRAAMRERRRAAGSGDGVE